MKNMRTLQKRIAYQLQQGSLDAEVTGITCDSRKVQPQNVFVCIRGNRMDGHVYAEEAVERALLSWLRSGNWKGFRKR